MRFFGRPATPATGTLPGARVSCERQGEGVDIETCFSCASAGGCAATGSALGQRSEPDVEGLERIRTIVRTTLTF